ncbi:MAG: 23S rRNA (guanosine(2251)-2'-O)-methyltransferase RlmB [Acidobacteria bacterium]|nr:23S rRNA (guanosine(2251)-2'-O)-methyltransferase RlmB [Acidobacteriota bacterium]
MLEALRAGRRQLQEVWIDSGREDGRAREILDLAAERGIPVARPHRSRIDRVVPGGVHQGVVAFAGPLPQPPAEEVLAGLGPSPLLLVLDGVEDPRNLGSLLRTAAAAGADAVLLPARRSAPLSPVAARASAGGSERIRVGRCGNVAGLLRDLRGRGIRTVGLDPGAGRIWSEVDYRPATALVLGGEGRGLRPLVRRELEESVRIPMQSGLQSLNVAVAAAVVLFEAVRQRRVPPAAGRGPAEKPLAGKMPFW